MLMGPTLKRGATRCRRIRGESYTGCGLRPVVAGHTVVAGLLTEPLVPTGTVSVAN